jgi:hypothetical protein
MQDEDPPFHPGRRREKGEGRREMLKRRRDGDGDGDGEGEVRHSRKRKVKSEKLASQNGECGVIMRCIALLGCGVSLPNVQERPPLFFPHYHCEKGGERGGGLQCVCGAEQMDNLGCARGTCRDAGTPR